MRPVFAISLFALTLASQAIAGMPEAQALYKQGNEAYRARHYEEAVKLYHEVVKEEPSYSDYIDKPLGMAYWGVRDEGKALFYLKRALERSPDDKNLSASVAALEKKDVLPDSSASGTDLNGAHIRNNVVYFNTGDLIHRAFTLGYERALNNHNSWLLDGVYGTAQDSTSSFQTYGLGAGWHFWFKRLSGAFIGPKASFQIGSSDDTVTTYTYNYSTYTYDYTSSVVHRDLARYSFGLEGGYQWLYDSGFAMAIGYGMFYDKYINGDPAGSSYYTYSYGSSSSIKSSLLFTLGFAF